MLSYSGNCGVLKENSRNLNDAIALVKQNFARSETVVPEKLTCLLLCVMHIAKYIDDYRLYSDQAWFNSNIKRFSEIIAIIASYTYSIKTDIIIYWEETEEKRLHAQLLVHLKRYSQSASAFVTSIEPDPDPIEPLPPPEPLSLPEKESSSCCSCCVAL